MRPLSLASDNASRPFSLWPKIRIPSENCLLTADFCFNFAAAVEADFLRFPNFRQMTPWNHRNRESKENKVAEVLETILQICYIHKMMKLWSLKECFMKRCLSKSCKVFNSSYVTMRVEASPNIIDAEANFWSFCCSEHKPFNYSGVFSKGRGIKSLERLRGHKNGRRSSEGQAFLITWPSP